MAKSKAKTRVSLQPGGGAPLPKTMARVTPWASLKPKFSFEYADNGYEGEWYWPSGEQARQVLDFLRNISTCTWQEISLQTYGNAGKRRPLHKAQNIESLCKEAKERIAQLRHDEIFEEVYRFRLGNFSRLWGYRVEETFHLLWWDPDHRVYPMDN